MAGEGYKNNTKPFMISPGIWRLGQRYNQIFYRLLAERVQARDQIYSKVWRQIPPESYQTGTYSLSV